LSSFSFLADEVRYLPENVDTVVVAMRAAAEKQLGKII